MRGFSGIILGVLLLSPGGAEAQNISIGFVLGTSFSVVDTDGNEFRNSDTRDGWVVGTLLGMQLSGPLLVRTGLYYVEKGTRGRLGVERLDIDAEYLEVPLLLGFQHQIRENIALEILGGPTLGYEWSCAAHVNARGTSFDLNCEDELNSKEFDVGLNIGGGLNFTLNSHWEIATSASFTFGLTSVMKADELEFRHRTFQIMTGLRYMP